MAKDKKKKKDKKAAKGGGKLTALRQHPLLADTVAAALVATASALKDPKRARALAADAGDELAKLSKAGAKSGEALWDMALQIGRRSLDALVAGDKPSKPAKPKAKTKSGAKKGSTKKPAASTRRK